MLRAALYCRVSTEEQATEGMSITAQHKALLDYAARHELAVAAEYIDEGVSARTADRPQFQRMISAARKKPRPFDLILIHKTDRFARNREDAIVYKSLLRRDCGIDVRSVTEQFEDSPTGKLLEGMMEVMAEFYSLNLSQEVLKGMREKAGRGKGMGLAPLGYRLGPDGQLQVMPEEAAIVRFIFSAYLQEEDGLLTIARRLHQEGISRFGPAAARFKWSSTGIRNILTNPTYVGTLIWNRRDGSRGGRMRRPEDWIVVEGAHEPIVDPETFAQAGEILGHRRGARSPSEDYLLRGLARCADCGGAMSYFRMQWRQKDGTRVVSPQLSCSRYHHSRTCYFNHAPLAEVEGAVLGYLASVLAGRVDPAAVAVTFPDLDRIQSEADRLRRQLAAAEVKLQRQLEAFEAGMLDLAELKAARDRVGAERAELRQQLAAQESKLAAAEPEQRNAVQRLVREVLATATNKDLPPASRRQALKSVIDHIEYSRREDHLRIVLRIG